MRTPVFRNTLQRTVAASMALLVVIPLGATLVLVQFRVRAALRTGLEARAVAIAESIGTVATPALVAYNYTALQLTTDGAARDRSVVYAVIYDKEGSPAAVTGPAPEAESPAPLLGAGRTRPTTGDTTIPTADGTPRKILEASAPVYVAGGGHPWGWVRVGIGYEAVEATLGRLTLQLAWLGALLTLLAVGFGLWIAGRITAPLRQLVKGTEALSAGDMNHRIPVQGSEELRDLAQSFNLTMDRLQTKARESADFQTALEVLNATLELQVQERTLELEESTAQYKTLVDHSPDSILIVQDQSVRFVNRAFVETFGVAESAALAPGFELSTIFEPSSAAVAAERIAAWERGESPSPAEILGMDSSGRTRHLELRGSRIEYEGRPAAECLLVDMTEAKRLRERLSETERLRALGELAGGVAHDFNNLLGAVLGRTQLLRRRGFPDEVDFEMAVIEKAAQDGRETVRRIQEFARTRRDRRFGPVDLSEVLRDAVEITKTRWKNDAMRRKITIDVVVETSPVPPIQGNASELREVFTNLVLNAVDAMPQGGTLRIECFEDGDRVVARVADTGVGMAESTRKHLFDPFFSTKGTRGLGLGLSVVYGIVTRHEGRIDVATALGRGTTFQIEFAACRTPARSVGGDGAELAVRPRPGRILVIDDEPEIAEVVKEVLAAEGHAVEMAHNGADGVQMASVTTYDVVFTDLGMPGMSGWDVAEVIRTMCPGLPVALVTGWGATLDEHEVERRGIAAVVNKPFDIEDLVRVTARLMAQHPAEAAPIAKPPL